MENERYQKIVVHRRGGKSGRNGSVRRKEARKCDKCEKKKQT